MTNAQVESKYLKRILGHASGEGSVTDGYGAADVPLQALVSEFRKVKFFPIDAHPWQPGKGPIKVSGQLTPSIAYGQIEGC